RRELIVKLIMEERDVEVVALRMLTVDRNVCGSAGLGFQIRITEHGNGALPAKAYDPIIELGCFRRFETRADAALERPLVIQGVNTVQTGADLIAEDFMVIQTQP